MSKTLSVLFYFAVIFFCLGVYIHSALEFQQDLGRHLLLGKIIWQTHQVPDVNMFSYTNSNFHFINTHWLSEVFFYLCSLISVPALIFVKVAVMSIAILLTVFTALRQNKNILAVALGFVVLSPILLERTEIRPEVFTYLLTSIFLYVILGSARDSRNSKWLWLLPVLEILWVNFHIYFILGPILVLFLAISKVCQTFWHTRKFKESVIRNSKFIIIFSLTTGTTLLNPHFISGALYPFHVFDNYGYSIVENQNILFLESYGVNNPNILYFKIGVLFFFASFLLTNLRKISFFNLFLSTLVILPIMNIRSFPLTFFLLLPVFSNNLANPSIFFSTLVSRYKFVYQICLIILICLILVRSFRLVSNDYYLSIDSEKRFGVSTQESGKGAVDFFLKNNLPGPIFNNFDIGGYLDYRLFPQIKVFIDNRPEAFPAKFIQNEYIPMQQSQENFDNVDKIYNFKTIIFAHTDGTPWGQSFLQMISRHSDWSLVYLDNYAVIYSKKGSAGVPSIFPVIPNSSNASYLSFLSLGRFFGLIGQNDLATQAFKNAYSLNPTSPLTTQAMSLIYPTLYQTHSSLPLF